MKQQETIPSNYLEFFKLILPVLLLLLLLVYTLIIYHANRIGLLSIKYSLISGVIIFILFIVMEYLAFRSIYRGVLYQMEEIENNQESD